MGWKVEECGEIINGVDRKNKKETMI